MKVYAIGITRSKGISVKKDPKGKPYDMCALLVLQPIEPGAGTSAEGGTWERSGFGYQVAEFQAEPACLDQFRDTKFPCQIDVITDTSQMFGRMVTVVTGLSAAKAA